MKPKVIDATIFESMKAVSTTSHYVASITWERNAQTQIRQDQKLCGAPAEPIEIMSQMSGDNAVSWRVQALGWPKTYRSTFAKFKIIFWSQL